MWQEHKRKRAASCTLLGGCSRPATLRERGMHVFISLFSRTKTQRLPACLMHLVVVVCSSSSAQTKHGQIQEKNVQDPKENLLLGVRTPNTVVILVPGLTQHLSCEKGEDRDGPDDTVRLLLPPSLSGKLRFL